MKKGFKTLLLALAGILALAGCGSNSAASKSGSAASDKSDQSKKEVTVKLGVVGSDTRVWDTVKDRLAKEGINIKYVQFSDYNQPDAALAEGSIDMNSYQHKVYLQNFNKESGSNLVSIGNTLIAPLAIYSHKYKKIKDVPQNAVVSIPNDVTNGGRALILLESAGLIKVNDKAGITPTVSDITSNPKHLEIKEMDASQTPASLEDVDIACINSGFAVDAGLDPIKGPIFKEPIDKNSAPYVNIIAVRSEDKNNKLYQHIVDVYQTEETAKAIKETSGGANIPAWKDYGRQ